MSPLILLAQAFFDHQARTQTDNLKLAGARAAEVGRRMALAGVFFSLAGALIFSSILIVFIDLGLQIDRGNGVMFSGLMISSSILIFVALIAAFGGWLISRDPKAHSVPPVAPPSPASELKPLLEAVAVGFLKEFLQQQRQGQQAQGQQQKKAPASSPAADDDL